MFGESGSVFDLFGAGEGGESEGRDNEEGEEEEEEEEKKKKKNGTCINPSDTT